MGRIVRFPIGIGGVVLAIAVFTAAAIAAAPQPVRVDRNDLIGEPHVYVTKAEENLLEIAREFDVGYVAMIAANPEVDPWLPGDGTRLTLPTVRLLPNTARRGIVINLSEMRLYYFPPNGSILSFPIGIGSEGRETLVGATRVVNKRPNPAWYPPPSRRAEDPDLPAVVPPGPDNPLGEYALYLGWPRYLIHGTNKPYGVGRRLSNGCIRLYPEDIARLYPMVSVGTPVTVIDEPVKLGWSSGDLYLEVHPTQAQADEIEDNRRFTTRAIDGLIDRVKQAAGGHAGRLDWELIARAAKERSGVPVKITR
ncbi:MAG: L,D-transpeptidase family protein [Alphaproteobacteria bacterium]